MKRKRFGYVWVKVHHHTAAQHSPKRTHFNTSKIDCFVALRISHLGALCVLGFYRHRMRKNRSERSAGKHRIMTAFIVRLCVQLGTEEVIVCCSFKKKPFRFFCIWNGSPDFFSDDQGHRHRTVSLFLFNFCCGKVGQME